MVLFSSLYPRMPSNTVLISGAAVGAAQSLIWSYSSVFLPPMFTAIRISVFSFVGALSDHFIFHRHRICLVDRVDLICSLYSWWKGFVSSSFFHIAPGFQLWFYFHLCTWIVHWGLLLRLPWRTWVCPCEGQVGGGAASWVSGVLATPGTWGGGGGG